MTSLRLSLLAACIAATGAASYAQDIVINEFSYDDSSTDDREFVELYNAGSTPVDISGWILDANDEAGPTTSNNADYTIPPGTIMQPGAFYVIGAGTVPNVNLIVGISDLWENSSESIELRDTAGTLIDAVAYETWAYPATPGGVWATDVPAQVGEGIWSTFASIDSLDCSYQRLRDGYDTDNNGRDFRQIRNTPGASNNLPSVLPVVEFFDSFAHGTFVPGWSASFVPFTAIDPTNQSPPNPMAFPASPQGGNASILWDPTGGGDFAALETDGAENVIFEAYVYFNATPEPAGEYESWTIGVQGSIDSYGNHPGFPGNPTATFTAFGGSGVAMVYQNDEFGGFLYLIDANDGGWGPTAVTPHRILGQIPIAAGVNDGWQRVRLQAGSDFAELRFGGTISGTDGQVLSGRTTMGSPGGIYMAYREFLANNATANPPVLDFLLIRGGIADAEYFGAATPNSVGTPALVPNSMATLGNAGFGFDASGLAPSSLSVLLIGFAPFATPLNLEPLGAPTGSRIYVDSAVGVTLVANGNGDASLALAIANDPALSGGAVYAQAINVDPAIGAPLPIAQTEAVKVTLGN